MTQRVKIALVTGAATGIGEALVLKLANEGWQVFAGYRKRTPEQASWWQHPQVTALQCDVADDEQCQQVAATIAGATSGRLDLLVNNAGYPSNAGVIEAADMADYRYTFEVNFWGVMQLIQACAPMLRAARGRIVNTASASVYMAIPMGSAYPVAKLAMKAMTHHLRLEMAPFGVQVTVLEPGGVETPMVDFTPDAGEQQWLTIPESLREEYRRHFLDGAAAVAGKFKFYKPEEFANRVYRQIVTAKRLKPSYLIGPGVAPLPYLQRLLPTSLWLRIWTHMFAARSSLSIMHCHCKYIA